MHSFVRGVQSVRAQCGYCVRPGGTPDKDVGLGEYVALDEPHKLALVRQRSPQAVRKHIILGDEGVVASYQRRKLPLHIGTVESLSLIHI